MYVLIYMYCEYSLRVGANKRIMCLFLLHNYQLTDPHDGADH